MQVKSLKQCQAHSRCPANTSILSPSNDTRGSHHPPFSNHHTSAFLSLTYLSALPFLVRAPNLVFSIAEEKLFS